MDRWIALFITIFVDSRSSTFRRDRSRTPYVLIPLFLVFTFKSRLIKRITALDMINGGSLTKEVWRAGWS